MEIIIDTLTGSSFKLNVLKSDTILSIKTKIQKHEGIPINQQHILWRNDELSDHCSLEDYKVSDGAHFRLVLGMRGGPLNTYCTPQLRLQFLKYSSFLLPQKKSNFPLNLSFSSNESSSGDNTENTIHLSSESDSNDEIYDSVNRKKAVKNAKDRTEYLIELSRLTEQRINLLIYHYENYIKLLSYPLRSSKKTLKTSESKLIQDFDSDDEEELEIQSPPKPITTATSTSTSLEAVVEVIETSKTPPLGDPPLFPSLNNKNNFIKRMAPEPWRILRDQDFPSSDSSSVLKGFNVQLSAPSCSSLLNRRHSRPSIKPVPFWRDSIRNRDDKDDNKNSAEQKEVTSSTSNKSRFDTKVAALDEIISSVIEEVDNTSNECLSSQKMVRNESIDNINIDWDFEAPDLTVLADMNDGLEEDIATLLGDNDVPPMTDKPYLLCYPAAYKKTSIRPSLRSFLSEKRSVSKNRLEEMQIMKDKVHELKHQMLKMKELREKRIDSLREARANNVQIDKFLSSTKNELDKKVIPPIIISDTCTDSEKNPVPEVSDVQTKPNSESNAQTYSLKSRRTWMKEGDFWRKTLDSENSDIPVPFWNQNLKHREESQVYLDLYTDIMSYLEEKRSSSSIPDVSDEAVSKSSSLRRLPPLSSGCESIEYKRPHSIRTPPKSKFSIFGTNLPSIHNRPPGLKLAPKSFLSKTLATTLSLSDLQDVSKVQIANVENKPLSSANTDLNLLSKSSTETTPLHSNSVHPSRCTFCQKRTGLANSYSCRCGKNFCSQHRYAEAHNCIHDYKSEARRFLHKANPLVNAPKLPKI